MMPGTTAGATCWAAPVSYTHLDVYKRQLQVHLEVVGLLQDVRKFLQLLGHDGVEHHVGAGDEMCIRDRSRRRSG